MSRTSNRTEHVLRDLVGIFAARYSAEGLPIWGADEWNAPWQGIAKGKSVGTKTAFRINEGFDSLQIGGTCECSTASPSLRLSLQSKWNKVDRM